MQNQFHTALDYLRRLTGNPAADFRPGQREAIEAALAGHRQAIIERTGWGKAAVYFIAARMLRDRGSGPALLISPLLSLMRNQIEAAARMGVRAVTINCTNVKDWDHIRDELAADRVDLLLISPERLGMADFFAELMTLIDRRIALLVIDEAHCISDWGHDFRPDYLRLRQIIRALPAGLPVLATTATANERVRRDLRAQLGPDLIVTRGPMLRTSLRLQNQAVPDYFERMAWLAGAMERIAGSGIVYVLTKRHAEDLAAWLRDRGFAAHAYHSDSGNAGGPSREELEQMLLRNEVKALVATVALGMGFDKPDLSFVIHFHRPASVVHYYQQVGRAGRGIADALGILLEGSEDLRINDYFIGRAFPPPEHVAAVLDEIAASPTGLTAARLYRRINLRKSQIDQVLKMLQYEEPSPLLWHDKVWSRAAVPYSYPAEKVERLTRLRQREQEVMREYLHTQECLMAFLARELDDTETAAIRCGRCANCIGRPLFEYHPGPAEVSRAEDFIRSRPLVIEPRKRLPDKNLLKTTTGIASTLSKSSQLAEPGRALAVWDFGTAGRLVRRGREEGHYDDELAEAAVRLIRTAWFDAVPPPFAWVTAIPSSRRPEAVPDLAQRLAARLGLPFVAALRSTGTKTAPQSAMNNSAAQLVNLDGEYEVVTPLPPGDVLLVDDLVDSRWTLTLAAALLRRHGSGRVFPLALALAPEFESQS